MRGDAVYDTVYLLDFDRTLANTASIATVFLEYMNSVDESLARTIAADQKRIEGQGLSFDLIASLERQVGSVVQEYIEQFVRSYQDRDFLNPGAHELIEYIHVTGAAMGIVTYGSVRWQHAKLALCCLDIYDVLIVLQPGQKGGLISSWYDSETGIYQLPDQLRSSKARRIVFVDDKLLEFQGFPRDVQRARGYVLTRVDHLPPTIVSVASLHEVIQHEVTSLY